MDRRIRLFYLLFVLYTVKAQTDYCQLSCGTTLQTVCERKNVSCGAGPDCIKNFKQMSLTDSDRRLVLDAHNYLRNKVATGQEPIGPQPQASNMKALSYSKELEYIAQCHTNSCKWGHDACRRTPKWGWVGQNLFLRSYKGGSITTRDMLNSSIYSLYDEARDFNPSWVSSFDTHGKEIGHYTAIVWARTRYVGCAITFFVDDKGWDVYYLACNYGEGGNVNGWSVYEVGTPASKCDGLPKNSKYPGLCGPDNV
uniref:SCP-like protein n=1 Tax=Diabrotica virgifera virgifera TaxID=50390 RepID=D7EYY3_DIAVI|nr:SCP-like protein [Diabrotica virgifera virgifera]